MKLSVKSITLVLIIALVLAFGLSFGFIMSDGVALADPPVETTLSSFSIGQTSDIHYFPYLRGYTPRDYGTNKDSYYASEFYFSMTGDTKLVEESASVLDASFEEMFKAAIDGVLPQIFIASGDLSKNGEIDALLDLANRLRLLQNDIRGIPGYENFQIICIPGNHDLFNGNGAYYKSSDGSSYKSNVMQTSTFALIFSGLGYPDNDLATLSTVFPASFWSTDYNKVDGGPDLEPTVAQDKCGFNAAGKTTYTIGAVEYKTTPFYGQYVASTTATNLSFKYYDAALQYIKDNPTMDATTRKQKYASLDASPADLKLNVLSYYLTDTTKDNFVLFGIDASFRAIKDDKAYVPYIPTTATLDSGKQYYSFALNVGFTPVTLSAAQEIVANDGVVYVDSGLNHETGGKVTTTCIDWMESVMNNLPAPADGGVERTGLITVHQNLLEHWEKEGEILKDFTLYNYEYIVKRLLNMGVRYGFTGHMHANDICYYTDAEGRTFYDVETGSMISYSSPKRYMTFTRYNYGTDFAEQFKIKNDILNTFAYDVDGDGVLSAEEKAINYNDYSNKVIYLQLIDRFVGHFISDQMIDDLLGSVRKLFADGGTIANITAIGPYHNLLGKVAMSLIKQLRYELDYTFKGTDYQNLVAYLKTVVDGIVSLEFGDATIGKMSIKQIGGFVAQAHSCGLEITTDAYYGIGEDYNFPTTAVEFVKDSPSDPAYRARYIAALQDLHEQCVNGSFVRVLLSSLLDPLYFNDNAMLKQILNHHYDLTKDENGNSLSELEIEQLGDLLALVEDLIAGDDETVELNINVSDFCPIDVVNGLLPTLLNLLDKALGFALDGPDLYTIVDTFLDSYLVDSFYVGIGGIADQIVCAFATDDMPDYTNPSNTTIDMIVYCDGTPIEGKYTYLRDFSGPIVVSQENGRIPSIINGHFEETQMYTLTYYTNEEIFTAVKLYDSNKQLIEEVTEMESMFNRVYMEPNSNQLLEMNESGDKIHIKTVATPIYYPLIDLGLACLTHTEVFKEVNKEEVPVTYQDRDMYYETNGVTYWNRHTVTFTNLQPGTKYYFNIAGTYKASNGVPVSFWYAEGNDLLYFETAPETAEEFSFLAIADIQGMTPQMYAETNKKLAAISDDLAVKGFNFVLNAGDVGDNSKNFVQMQYAFDYTGGFFNNTSTFVTSGNHENKSYMMNRFFDYTLPDKTTYPQTGETGLYYSFVYGNSYFIVLDTNDATGDKGLGEKQLEWLTHELNVANQSAAIKHIFVLMHKSMFSCGSHTKDPEILKMKEQLVPLFANNNVDLVLSGHDHTYSITNKIDKDGKVTLGKGVMYVTLGTMGTKFYEYKESEDTTPLLNASDSIFHTLDTQTFAYITVSGDSVTVNGYTFVGDTTGGYEIIAIENQLEEEIKNSALSENGSLGKTFYAGFTSHKTTEEYKVNVPLGYKVVYVANGQEYSSLSDVKVKGAKANVEVKAVNTKTGEEIVVDNITLEVKNYSALLAVCIVVPVVVVGAVACVVVLMLLKKKKAK